MKNNIKKQKEKIHEKMKLRHTKVHVECTKGDKQKERRKKSTTISPS